MRRFALSGLLVSTVYIATTLAGTETVQKPGATSAPKVVGDTIVISDCRLGVINKVDVASPRTGQLKWLALAEVDLVAENSYRYVDPTRKGESVPANRDVLPVEIEILPGQTDPPGRKVYTKNSGSEERRFYRQYYIQLIEGDEVTLNQHLGQLDDRVASAEFSSKAAKMEASRADVVAAEKTRDEAKARLDTSERLMRTNSTSLEEHRAAGVTFERYKSELISKTKMVDVAREELSQARVLRDLHEIRSPFRGVVKSIYKTPGEALREQEPVVQIHNLDKLRIDGLVDAQYQSRIRPGMKAVVESPLRYSPQTLKGHLQEVTCVAVTNHRSNPRIVSVSEDGTLRVWDHTAVNPEVWKFEHPKSMGFRTVACAPAKASGANLAVAGSVDGTVWVFDLDRNTVLHKIEKAHHGVVNTVAFNADGSQIVSTGEDRPRGNICVWETASGKQRMQMSNVHGGAVTGVQFTATNHVVTTSRDNTMRVWKPGAEGKYETALILPRRSGDVPNLGVSPDGKHVLFDQGKELRMLTLPEGQYAGSISNPSGTSPFTTMALFSPDPEGRLVLTAGSAEGRLQLWRKPSMGRRGQELIHLIPPDRSQPTSGAFAPNGQFLVTGTKDRLVHVWPMPGEMEVKEQIIAEIMHVEAGIESGGRQIRIRADVPNANKRLLLNDTVTMVVNPQ